MVPRRFGTGIAYTRSDRTEPTAPAVRQDKNFKRRKHHVSPKEIVDQPAERSEGAILANPTQSVEFRPIRASGSSRRVASRSSRCVTSGSPRRVASGSRAASRPAARAASVRQRRPRLSAAVRARK